MVLYRITQSKYAYDLSGSGGLYVAGRWHEQGTHILYTAEHVALVKLEVLANSTGHPKDVSLITLETPPDPSCLIVSGADLPTGWDQLPYHPTLAQMTDDWITNQKYWIMRVPSVHSPTEYNYLLNPLHPDHNSLKIINITPHLFDTRLK